MVQMREYEYHTLDVFTDKPFSGNPLAVFPDASGLTSEEMQKIAAEFNLSETVFVLESGVALRKLRIFTPVRELPLAGHPVVGTWNLLARLGIPPRSENGQVEIEQELKLGVLPVTLDYRDGEIFTVEMEQGAFEANVSVTSEPEIEELAAALGLLKNEIGNAETGLCQVVSTGIRSLAVPLLSLETLKKCRVDNSRLSNAYLKHGAVGVYVFCFDTVDGESLIHARFFAPADGIQEDPATGSAAGALSGYLVHNGFVREHEFTIEQGDIMGRPGRIFARVKGGQGKVESVRIGGKSVPISKGTITIP